METPTPNETDAIRAALPQVAAAVGAPPPGDGRSMPTIPFNQPSSAIAFAVAQVMATAPLFRNGEEFVTVHETTGETLPMTVTRWRTWYQRFFHFVEGEGDKRRIISARQDPAAFILASDELRAHVRELRGVNLLRLPVWRGEGDTRTIELLPTGYDSQTKTFTVPALAYPENWTLDESLAWFTATFGEFCFAEDGDLFAKRSFAAVACAMLGVFAVNLLPPSAVRPMVPIIGNQVGLGKSKLARALLAAVHGEIGEGSKPGSDEELRNILDASALAAKPYIVLDDVKNLASNDLNHIITSPTHEARVKGLSIVKKCPNVWQVFVTGNWLKSSEDIPRRTMPIFLMVADKATDRVIKREMTDTWLFSPAYRAPACAALWALLRHWINAGMPICAEARLGSFEHYAKLFGSAIVAAGITNPFQKVVWPMGGDEAGRALEMAICRAAGAAKEGDELTPDDILNRLSEDETRDIVLSGQYKGENGERKALGHRLARLRGRTFTDTRDRLFEFGHKDGALGARYTLHFLAREPEA